MSVKYSEQLNNVFTYSLQEAERLGNAYVGPEHLLLGLIRNGSSHAAALMQEMGVDINSAKQRIEAMVRTDNEPSGTDIPMLKSTEKIKKIMELEARSLSAEAADTEHLLLAILKDKNNLAVDVLSADNLTYEKLIMHINPLKPQDTQASAGMPHEDDEEDDDQFGSRKSKTKQQGNKPSETPALDTFGTDITKAAVENRLDPVVGREREIERIAQILSRRKKNNIRIFLQFVEYSFDSFFELPAVLRSGNNGCHIKCHYPFVKQNA